MKTIRHTLWLVISLCVLPNTVFAHGIFKGLNSFYNGFLHPVFVPSQLIAIIALGLFLGQQSYKGHRSFFSFSVAVLIGLIATGIYVGDEKSASYLITENSTFALLITSLSASALIVFNLKIPNSIGLVLLIIGGFFIGLDSIPPNEMINQTLFNRDKWLFLFGVCVAVYLLFLYPLTLAEVFKKAFWQKVVIRILASWIAASSLMVWAISLMNLKQ